MITGKNIHLKYKNCPKYTIKGASFELQAGRITAFIGRSGAGKTTLLKCLANLNCHYEGIISYFGKDLKGLLPQERASAIGFVLQQFHLFPHLTLLENCTLSLKQVLGLTKQQSQEIAIPTLEMLGMTSFLHYYPSHLSGGQQQRGAIARALVMQPKILLLDEPTSALDPDSKNSLETLLKELQAGGITIALSSHDMPFIRKMMDAVYFMEEGQIVESWDKQKEELESKEKIKKFVKGDR